MKQEHAEEVRAAEDPAAGEEHLEPDGARPTGPPELRGHREHPTRRRRFAVRERGRLVEAHRQLHAPA
jgi:hypothetical protein